MISSYQSPQRDYDRRIFFMTKENEIVLFETKDKKITLPVEVKDETVWLSVSQMAQLFDREESNIRRHVLNVFKENEVDENNNVYFLHVNNVKKPVPFYSLDVIISVGYRVKSNRGVEFRRWANSVLKQYILQGYAVNQKRIQQLGEVIRIMKRTENELDSKQILSVIERYNNALDLLDAYDHQTMKRPKGNEATYSTAEYAQAIIEGISLKEFKENNKDRKVVMEKYNKLIEAKQIVFTTFHQSYGYEEFIQGLRPDTKSEKMTFKTVDGVFKQIADKAIADPEKNYVIIIDEINRANISKVFGELITLIEEDKRWGELNQTSATLQSGDLFAVPNNLYIIGTMNSADKSISLIDAALRRRFEFVEQKPDASLVLDPTMKEVLEKLNKALVNQLGSADLLIGHSYFMNKTEEELPKVLNNSIIPLLYEYFYDNKKKVMSVLEDSIKNTNCAVEDDQLGRIFIERQKLRNDS